VQVIKRAVRNVYEMGLEDFIFGHPAQIALLGIQYQWTADTQVCWGQGAACVEVVKHAACRAAAGLLLGGTGSGMLLRCICN
jgi:dynein heavy chain